VVTTDTDTTVASAGPAPRRARPRADALRNRERIVSAAREMFVEFGAEVPFDDIARRAGVGNATLYRHFPDRGSLVHEVVVSVMTRTLEEAAAAADRADPFDSVRRFTHAAADQRAGALCAMISGSFDEQHAELVTLRTRLEGAVNELLGRAQSAGRMRTDIAVGDLMVAVFQLTRPLPGSRCGVNDRFVHRHLQVFLDGLEAPSRSELPGSAATLENLRNHGDDEVAMKPRP
jgi:AcrR family transcriptional regulator